MAGGEAGAGEDPSGTVLAPLLPSDWNWDVGAALDDLASDVGPTTATPWISSNSAHLADHFGHEAEQLQAKGSCGVDTCDTDGVPGCAFGSDDDEFAGVAAAAAASIVFF